MRLSKLIGRRFKQKPADAALVSHAFLLRGGYVRQVANGIYSLLPLGLKVVRNIERIIREEMDAVGGQEVQMPVVLPRELWDESGRYEATGSELLKFIDRTGHDMVLAMTHEEGVVHLSRHEVESYKQYPFMLYQFQTKFRDEPRSRGGLIRVREFTMKDAYSFHTSQDDMDAWYGRVAGAYTRIFERLGVPEVIKVQSDTGMMGGSVAHEYMLLTDCGEDTVVTCPACGYTANQEVAAGVREYEGGEPLPLEKVATPGSKTIAEVAAFLKVPETQTAKAVFYQNDADGKPVLVIIRGDLEVNEAKLAKLIKVQPVDADEMTVRRTGAVPGYASGMGLTGCRIIADESVKASANLVAGANEEGFHLKNFNLQRDLPGTEIADIASVAEGDGCPECGKPLAFERGIEVGNIFQLGTKYTGSMGMTYVDSDGKEQVPLMGCYGIGIGRLVSAIMEARHDKFGPLWPRDVAPFEIHINALNLDADQKADFSDPVYEELCRAGYRVVYDDRDERPGVQFADADLIGAPLRLIFGVRNYADRMVEWKLRDGAKKGLCAFDEVMKVVGNVLPD